MLSWNREFTEAEKGLFDISSIYPMEENEQYIKYGLLCTVKKEMPSEVDEKLFIRNKSIIFDKIQKLVEINGFDLDIDDIALIYKRMEELECYGRFIKKD